MKFLVSQISYVLGEREMRRNLGALLKFLAVLCVVIAIFTAVFHWIMVYVEGRTYSWITGLYWTLTVMSTLGFGDITFESDLGRAFSIFVLMTGIVLLLIVLPFAFIRYAYAPWLEAQIRTAAPRELPEDTTGHVLFCSYDSIAQELTDRLDLMQIPYFVIEQDPKVAATLYESGIRVVTGELDNRKTYAALRARAARLVLANLEDRTNTNITLTVREESSDVPILALANDRDAIDILQLGGATEVLPLRHRLGEQLASRVTAGGAHVHMLGNLDQLAFGEFPIHGTTLGGTTVRESRLREDFGINVVAIWERGRLCPVRPNTILADHMFAVVVGPAEQLTRVEEFFVDPEGGPELYPILVIGGGKVGRSAARALKRRGLYVTIIERDPSLGPFLEGIADCVIIGDAANRRVMDAAGIGNAPSVILTTNDDATNIYLSLYCRKLGADTRVISRITHGRNLEAIHRAGADFVLSYSTLGAKFVLSMLSKLEPVILGEGVDIIIERVPDLLAGKTLAESGIGQKTGLTVVATRENGSTRSSPGPQTELKPECQLVMLGTPEQLTEFRRAFS